MKDVGMAEPINKKLKPKLETVGNTSTVSISTSNEKISKFASARSGEESAHQQNQF